MELLLLLAGQQQRLPVQQSDGELLVLTYPKIQYLQKTPFIPAYIKKLLTELGQLVMLEPISIYPLIWEGKKAIRLGTL